MRCAIIGLGMAVTPHAKSLVDLRDRVEVAAAYSRTAVRREAFAERFGLPVTDDLDGIVGDPSIDYAVLLTPPNARAGLVRRLAAAGKHILMEKPVERTTAAAEEIVRAAEQAGVTLGIVLQHRFRAVAERLAERLASGALGTLAAASITVPWWREQAYYDEPGRGTFARDGGGVLISQAIHTLDLALSFTGPVSDVVAVGGTTPLHRMEAEDFVAAGIRFASGAHGSLMATTAFYPGAPERIELACSHTSAVLGPGGVSIRHHDGREEDFGEARGSGSGADPMDFPHDAHRALHADFIDALAEGRAPRVTGRGALGVHRFIDALVEATRTSTAVPVAGDRARDAVRPAVLRTPAGDGAAPEGGIVK